VNVGGLYWIDGYQQHGEHSGAPPPGVAGAIDIKFLAPPGADMEFITTMRTPMRPSCPLLSVDCSMSQYANHGAWRTITKSIDQLSFAPRKTPLVVASERMRLAGLRQPSKQRNKPEDGAGKR